MLSSSLAKIVNGLRTAQGLDFNVWIAEAFKSLHLNAEVIQETQAESDVIAEALFAEEPYYVVIEGQAVRNHNEVGYDKLGQLRGNFPSYMDERRQKLFKNAYKLVVGRPRFSSDARRRAEPDVVLITDQTFTQLLEIHSRFRFSQDELELLFKREDNLTYGEIELPIISRHLLTPKVRRINVIALVLYCLGAGTERRKWLPVQQVIGMAKVYGRFLKIDLGDEEIMNAILDLQSSLLRLILRRDDRIRFISIPVETIKSLIPIGGEILSNLSEFSERLSSLEKT